MVREMDVQEGLARLWSWHKERSLVHIMVEFEVVSDIIYSRWTSEALAFSAR